VQAAQCLRVVIASRGWIRAIWDFLGSFERYPACPICGRVYYIKTMPLHLSGHKPDDPDVVAWWEPRHAWLNSASRLRRSDRRRHARWDISVTVLRIPASEYHADAGSDVPTLSSSIAVDLIAKTPAHAYLNHPKLNPSFAPQEDKKAWDLGTFAHSLLLEGYSAAHVVEGYENWRTNDAKSEASRAREAGKIPMLRHEFDEASAMVDAAREQIETWNIDPPLLDAGTPELTLRWDENGVGFRCRPDWLRDDRLAIDDIKTSSRGADPRTFARKTIYDLGYDLKAAMYLRGVKAEFGVDAKWRWIVIETKPPYLVSVVEPSDEVLQVGNAKLDRAIEIWRECLSTGIWPGYGPKTHIADLPVWQRRWIEEALEEEVWATL
jgi:hypothetical protein